VRDKSDGTQRYRAVYSDYSIYSGAEKRIENRYRSHLCLALLLFILDLHSATAYLHFALRYSATLYLKLKWNTNCLLRAN